MYTEKQTFYKLVFRLDIYLQNFKYDYLFLIWKKNFLLIIVVSRA